VKMVNKLKKSNGVRFGLCLAACLTWSSVARAEVELMDKDGWTFSFDGRVDAFASAGAGDAFPLPTPDPNGSTHQVMGFGSTAGKGRADVGWPQNDGQTDPNNKYLAIRVRSGMYANILGFGITRKINETTSVRGYISIWSTVETLGYDKWAPINAEAREGYFNIASNWGTVTVGRTLALLGRMSWEIDTLYGHGYGVGLPCTDALGPACGHIGTGYVFPGYGANIAYTTPSLAGLQLRVALFDPVTLGTDATDWSHASIMRPEGDLTFTAPLGEIGKVKLAVEGLYQPIARCPDSACMMDKVNSAIWGVSGGARLEVGPLRLGFSGFTGKGLGLFYALQRSVATEDNDPTNHTLRTFTGFYGQGGVAFGKFMVTGGFGLSLVNQTTFDKSDATVSTIHYQRGISAAAYYHATENIAIGLDWFMFAAGWYGAPLVDPNTMAVTGKLAGETQVLNFVNAGVTYHW